MTSSFVLKGRRDAQTLVFFLLAFGTIILLCGLAIDSGLLYLAKARISRAVDGAALVAVGNFSLTPSEIADSMRNFAAANFTSLESISSTPTSTTSNTVTTAAGSTTTLTYWYDDTTAGSDSKGYKKYVEVILTTGSGGQVTAATCNARCPAQTFFIGFAKGAFPILGDLNVSSAAQATRNPRLVMIVVDRSASMLLPSNDSGSYGAFGLPQSIVTFLDFFEPGADYIGLVSFSSNARLEMPLTTNFLNAATNNLIDSYSLASNAGSGSAEAGGVVYGVPGIDPEMQSANADYEPGYATNGVRRMKFGGDTAADEGMRVALECLMSNSGFNNPDVVKYIVLFTDGRWNNSRTLLAAPTYTNTVTYTTNTFLTPYKIVTNTAPNLAQNLVNATNVYFQPSLSPMPYYTNEVTDLTLDPTNFSHHAGDYWISLDTNGGPSASPEMEPLPGSLTTTNSGTGMAGVPTNVITTPLVGLINGTNVYSSTINVWLQPGAVDIWYHNTNTVEQAYLGDYNSPTNTVTIGPMVNGDSNVVVVPGYVVDGCVYDGLDLDWYCITDNGGPSGQEYFRADNFNTAFEWPDDQTAAPTTAGGSGPFYYTPGVNRDSLMRSLLFRNYANMLTGFYVFRADDPLGTGVEPLDTSPTWPTGTPRPLNGLGAYYPSAAVYWPFDLVGFDWDPGFALTNALSDPDATEEGMSHHLAYTINMLSTNADPEQAGELFYGGTGGPTVLSGTTAESTVMSSAGTWQNNAPGWLTAAFGTNMTTDTTLNTNITPNPQNWRPNTFRGYDTGATTNGLSAAEIYTYLQAHPSTTGGYVVNGTTGEIYKNTMCWNGRPTHFYNFSTSSWEPLYTDHDKNVTFLPVGYWKAQEYAWHARANNVTIYTVGYGSQVADSELVILAAMANATNVNTSEGTNGPNTYNSSQPIGQEYYADTTNAISNDFYQIGTAINAALTQ